MGTAHSFKTDLYSLFDYVQQTQIIHPKEVIIETLRNFFEQDSYYHYSRDVFGFPNVTDHTELPLDAGLNDDVTTRLYIGEPYRYDQRYYPSLLVKHGGSKSRPISMSRNKGVVQWTAINYLDGYGNSTTISTPSHYVQAGAWEGTVSVDVEAKSPRARDELAELVSVSFVDVHYEDLEKAGVVIKSGSPSVGTPSEEDDRNDKIFKVSVTFEVYSEWRRHLSIDSVVDAINVCVEFGNISQFPPRVSENLRIVTAVDVIDAYSNL